MIFVHLIINGKIQDLDYNKEILHIFSSDVLKKIKSCENGTWENMVPKGVADIIKKNSLFGAICKIK